MMKKKIAAGLICLVLICTCFPLSVFAANNIQEEDCSLTIGFHNDELAIPGADFDIYYAASWTEDLLFEPEEPFSGYPVSFNDLSAEAWNSLAETLKGYVIEDEQKPLMSGETDEEGWVKFEGLEPGLYFVLGSSTAVDDYLYTPLPFFAVLPEKDEETGALQYDVTAEAKNEKEPISAEPETRKVLKIWKDEGAEDSRPEEIEVTLFCDKEEYDTVTLDKENNWRYEWKDLESGHEWTVSEKAVEGYNVTVERQGTTFTLTNKPDQDAPTPVQTNTPVPTKTPYKLPYTGMLRWPIPVLIIAGVICILAGFIRRRGA